MHQQLIQLTVRGVDDRRAPAPALIPGSPRTSSYCIFVKLPARPDHVLLVHGYTGAYDEVSLDVAAFLYARRTVSTPLYGNWVSEFDPPRPGVTLSDDTLAELEERGYLTTLTVDQERERLASIAETVHAMESTSLNYILVPGYDCNLRCPYCFQDYMRTDPSFRPRLRRMTPDLVDRILDGIVDLEAQHPDESGEERQFTLFGGEPLLAANHDIVEYIVGRATALGPCSIGAVTNGTDLASYRDLLGPDAISSLQITLDGPAARHDRFRVYANGDGSFERIAGNVGLALERNVAVAIRVNVCKDNVNDLPALAREAMLRRWTDHANFQMYAAPIQPTDAFSDRSRLLNSRELGDALRSMAADDAVMAIIQTADDGMKERALRLFRDPEIDPIADFRASYCGAHSGMFIFDPFGDIYACWERMGDSKIRIGSVGADGTLRFDAPMLSRWRSRTVASNPTCESCAYSLHCGGGCAVLAEAHNGEYFSNFCDGFGARFRTAVAAAYEQHLAEQEGPSGADSGVGAGAVASAHGCR